MLYLFNFFFIARKIYRIRNINSNFIHFYYASVVCANRLVFSGARMIYMLHPDKQEEAISLATNLSSDIEEISLTVSLNLLIFNFFFSYNVKICVFFFFKFNRMRHIIYLAELILKQKVIFIIIDINVKIWIHQRSFSPIPSDEIKTFKFSGRIIFVGIINFFKREKFERHFITKYGNAVKFVMKILFQFFQC